MRTCAVLICLFLFLASPTFFAYFQAEGALQCSDFVGPRLEPWLLWAMTISAILTPALLWIVGMLGEEDSRL